MGWGSGSPTPDELTGMKKHLTEWIDAGAVGMAAGLGSQPGAFSPTSELIALCQVLAEAGGVYAPHQRGYWQRLPAAARESFRIGRESGVKVHISHLAIDETAAGLLDEAQASGVDISFDMYPYSAACTHLLMMLPEGAQAGGYQASMVRLAEPEERKRIQPDTASRLTQRR